MARFIASSPKRNFSFKSLLIKIFILIIVLFIFRFISNPLKKIIPLNAFNFPTSNNQNILTPNAFGISFKDNVTPSFHEKISSPQALIYLYNTYQTDKYYSTYQNSYNINNYVIQVDYILQEYLKNYNIASLVETRSIYQKLKELNLSSSHPYEASRIFLEETINQNPSLKCFLDLQLANDTTKDEVVLANKEYAKIRFVVGTKNPNYEENKAFADSLNALLKSKYPELSLGVTLRGQSPYNGLYNQDLNSQVLLLEIGNTASNISSINNTLKVLSEIIYLYLNANK